MKNKRNVLNLGLLLLFVFSNSYAVDPDPTAAANWPIHIRTANSDQANTFDAGDLESDWTWPEPPNGVAAENRYYIVESIVKIKGTITIEEPSENNLYWIIFEADNGFNLSDGGEIITEDNNPDIWNVFGTIGSFGDDKGTLGWSDYSQAPWAGIQLHDDLDGDDPAGTGTIFAGCSFINSGTQERPFSIKIDGGLADIDDCNFDAVWRNYEFNLLDWNVNNTWENPLVFSGNEFFDFHKQLITIPPTQINISNGNLKFRDSEFTSGSWFTNPGGDPPDPPNSRNFIRSTGIHLEGDNDGALEYVIEIEECTFTGFRFGIVSEIENNTSLQISKSAFIEDATYYQDERFPLGWDAITINGGNARIFKNFIWEWDNGIIVSSTDSIYIHNNIITQIAKVEDHSEVTDSGIHCLGASRPLIFNNIIFDGENKGITVEANSNPIIIFNTIVRFETCVYVYKDEAGSELILNNMFSEWGDETVNPDVGYAVFYRGGAGEAEVNYNLYSTDLAGDRVEIVENGEDILDPLGRDYLFGCTSPDLGPEFVLIKRWGDDEGPRTILHNASLLFFQIQPLEIGVD